MIPASARVQVTPAVTPALRRMLISAGIGLVASPLVLGIGLLLSYLAWTPLGAIPKAASAVVQPGTCTTLTPGTIQMYVCSAWVAVKTSAGSLMMLAALLGIGLPFALVMRRVLAPVPVPIRAAVSALTVTGGATMLWSGMLTGDLTSYRGFVWPQQLPALLGAYTFLLACFSPLLQSLFAPVLRLRDKIPRVILLGVAAAVPLLATLLLFPPNNAVMSETQAMSRQQAVVALALAVGTVALFPRGRNVPAISPTRLLAPLTVTPRLP